jgi:F-type H+-transporting ATPase subunit delta
MSDRLGNNKVASRYAKALFESTLPLGQIDAVARDLSEMDQVFTSVPALTGFLENPGIPMAEKIALLEQQFGESANPWVMRLLKLLIENNRIVVFPQLVQQFHVLINQRENTAQAEVVSAVELEEELRTRIRKILESTFGFNRVDIQNRVDPGLLGGVIVKIQDQVIDGSYVGRLEELRKQISTL